MKNETIEDTETTWYALYIDQKLQYIQQFYNLPQPSNFRGLEILIDAKYEVRKIPLIHYGEHLYGEHLEEIPTYL